MFGKIQLLCRSFLDKYSSGNQGLKQGNTESQYPYAASPSNMDPWNIQAGFFIENKTSYNSDTFL